MTYALLLSTSLSILAQTNISNLDFSFQYNASSRMRGQILSSLQDSVALIQFKIAMPLDSLRDFEVSYSLTNSIDQEITSQLKLKSLASYYQYEDETGSQYGLIAKIGDANYFVLWLNDTLKNTIYPYVKALKRAPESEGLIVQRKILNAPIFESYIPVGETIRIKSLSENNQIKIDYYDYHFQPAKPPMSQIQDGMNTTFTHDRSFELNSDDTLFLAEKGLYYIHLDGVATGYSVLATEEDYPKFGSIDRLVESLLYLATEEEYLKMTTSFNQKELFDQFWLNNTRSEEKARRSIREYYARIKEANMLFTSYKEGWKTDMGMIYMIFGPPARVFLKDNGVMWIYNKSFELPRVAFFFNHVNIAFTGNYYVLERRAEFQNLWFRTVDLWRSGKKEF